MTLLKSRFQGVIHLLATAKGGLPEVEFEDGEGPGQVMDQIQTFAVPWIKQAVDPAGPSLLWEELDPEAGEVRRHRSLLEGRLEFELCPDDQGIELVLSGGEDSPPGRAWVPLKALAEPGPRQRAALGWTVEEPRFAWRYVGIGKAPAIEITWSCGTIYRSWAEEIERRHPVLKCRLGAKSVCQLSIVPDRPLSYRGHFPLPQDSWLPARWRLGLDVPLVVRNEDDPFGRDRHGLDAEVPVTVDALDFRAVVAGRTTRLVSLDDLAERFEAEVLTTEEVLLPDEVPAGLIPGLPWTVSVERHAPETAAASSSNGKVRAHPAVVRHRRWTLRPQGADGYWGQVDWADYPPRLAFALGSAETGEAPEIARIPERKATVGWRVLASEEDDELLCFTIPHWIPMGELGNQLALPCRENGHGEYASEVRARIDGLEERFSIDPGSEIAVNRVYLDPRHWRFYDESVGELQDAEALGEVNGYVRWRRPAAGEDGEGSLAKKEVSPTDWAGGTAPVLLIRRPDEAEANVLDWGGFYAAGPVPWQVLEEVRPEKTGFDLVLTPRASLDAVWISLWGFLCRYDRRPVIFDQTRRPAQEIVTWVARSGLELFPGSAGAGAGRAFLTRSFSPLYAVSDKDPRIFALEDAGGPRPVLRLGRELHDGDDLRSIRIGEGTYVRYQVTEPDRLPDSFSPGRIPGRSLLLPRDAECRVVWFALKQHRERAASRQEAGYLLSWDASEGWRFRGFFAERDAAVELGKVRLGDQISRVFLGDETRAGRRAFQLTIDSEGHTWSASTPREVSGRVTAEMIAEWERHYYAPDELPSPLADYEVRILSEEGPCVFELLEREHVFDLDPPSGIRVWEPQEGAAEELFAGVKVLGEDEPSAAAPGGPPAGTGLLGGGGVALPKKRLLKADLEDEDDF